MAFILKGKITDEATNAVQNVLIKAFILQQDNSEKEITVTDDANKINPSNAGGNFLIHCQLMQVFIAIVNVKIIVKGFVGDTVVTTSTVSVPSNQVADVTVDLQMQANSNDVKFTVSGRVLKQDGSPVQNIIVLAFDKDHIKDTPLGNTTTNADGFYQINYNPAQFKAQGKEKVDLIVKVFDVTNKEIATSEIIASVNLLQNEKLNLITQGQVNPNAISYKVSGKVFSNISAGIGNLKVIIVDKGVGGDLQLAVTNTDRTGNYNAVFNDEAFTTRDKTQPDLQARVFSGDVFIGASDVRYNATAQEVINVLLPDSSFKFLKSEFELLMDAIETVFKGKPGTLVESDVQQDITYIANKIGWDARAIALAALSDQFSTSANDPNGNTTIVPQYFYALFRSGVPSDIDLIFHTDAKTIQNTLAQASAQGIIPASTPEQIQTVITRFSELSVDKMLSGPAIVGLSSLKDLLTVSGINEAQHAQVANLYATNRGDLPAFWKSVTDALGNVATNRLQLDSKLAFLSINNAPLIKALHATIPENGLNDALQLAEAGYYRPEFMKALLTTNNIQVPAEVQGETPEDKLTNYSIHLSTQIRVSYPTASVAHMVASGIVPVSNTVGVADKVQQFLNKNQDKFIIGVHPVEQFIKDNNLSANDAAPETISELKRIHRAYQLTNSDEAFIGLLKNDLDSSHKIIQYDRADFIASFSNDFTSDAAGSIYDRAMQIHTAMMNISLSYFHARTAPAVGVHSPAGTLDPTPANTGDIIAMQSLDKLFGTVDFCDCEDCQSILSPSAYLVDLLQFIDNGKSSESNPLKSLLKRRPDIQYLPLTCENTNTALPYLDIVNETMEYFIANGLTLNDKDGAGNASKLGEYKGHDTKDISSENLLASPQYMVNAAYDALRNEYFPLDLPFHQPLELLRRYFKKMELPLITAMESLLKPGQVDKLERDNNSYGWRDIWMEEINLSRQEYDILTDSAKVSLQMMFGYPAAAKESDILNTFLNAKQFANKIGITYDDIFNLLRTQFINPDSDLIPKIERLGVTLDNIKALKDGVILDDNFRLLLPTDEDKLDESEYGGDIVAWVKNDVNYSKIMRLITLAIPVKKWMPNQAYLNGDLVIPTSMSVSSLYFVCTSNGISGPTEPIWSPSPGIVVDNGTAQFTGVNASSAESFQNLYFRFSDPDKLLKNIGTADLVRMMRFIRIWKKLGWTIEQTDAALCTFYKADYSSLSYVDVGTQDNLDAGFKRLLPRLGVACRIIDVLNLNINKELFSLLSCWADIGTHGSQSLYSRMFLNPTILSQDAVFKDNGFGEYLQDTSQTILDTGSPQKLILSGSALSGDVLNTIINGTAVAFEVTVAMTNNNNDIAAGISAAINAATAPDLNNPDPDNNNQPLRLNQVVTATAVSNIITITKSSKATSFTLGASVSTQGTLIYKTLNHEPILRAAFNLTSDEFNTIAISLGFDVSTPLNFANISAIYKRGWLARKLKISVKELLLLIQFTGFDPFADIDLVKPQALQLIEFIELAKNSGFKSAATLYLLWNKDLSGKSSPANDELYQLARSLRSDFNAIDTELNTTEDPNGDLARNRIALAYGQEISDNFFALLDNTVVIDVAYTHTADVLEDIILKADSRISYDSLAHRLKHFGLISAPTQNTLKNLAGVSQDFKDAIDALFNKGEASKDLFFNVNPELKKVYDEVITLNTDPATVFVTDYDNQGDVLNQALTDKDPAIQYDKNTKELSYKGFLVSSSRDILKNTDGMSASFFTALDALFIMSQLKRNSFLVQELNPSIALIRKQQQVLQQLSSNIGMDVNSVKILINTDLGMPFVLHAIRDTSRPALDDFIALQTPGLKAEYYFRNTATGEIDVIPEPVVANLDYGPDSNKSKLPNQGNPISVVLSGAIEIPQNGFYNFIIDTDVAATVNLTIDSNAMVLNQSGTARRNAIALQYPAGSLLNIQIKIENVQTALSLKWETPSSSSAIIPSQYLYPSSILFSFIENYVRFLKVTSIGATLSLTANELSFFGLQDDYKINSDGWLNVLPVDDLPVASLAQALVKPFKALLRYSSIKDTLASSDDSLIQIMSDPSAATKNASSLLFITTQWNPVFLNDLLVHYGAKISRLNSFELLQRIFNAFSIIQQTGISPRVLIQSTTNDPTADVVINLQSALRALYEPDSWLDLIKPINDEMRSLQRDALVAYILRFMPDNIDTPDKLFEYFLMDVEMAPCMETSRIRHALSSVQLFIERCIMNLEREADTSAFDSNKLRHWNWMKRYRVWEANRKVYLWPENWAEPELRDDQSSFFKESMSELLQSDITEDTAATALLNYLTKLEEVAKLEPCGLFHDENTHTDHVVARTAGAHRKYYYRKKQDGSWSPWEQIKLDIEDNPIIPVVWKNRLFLFWLKITKSPAVLDKINTTLPTDNDVTFANAHFSDIRNKSFSEASDNTSLNIQAILCWSEYYNSKWQATKSSDVNSPLDLGKFSFGDFNRFDLNLFSYESYEGLNITIYTLSRNIVKTFLLYNTHSLPTVPVKKESWYGKDRNFDSPSGVLQITYSQSDPRDDEPGQPIPKKLISDEMGLNIVESNQSIIPFGIDLENSYIFFKNSWETPFFLSDYQNVFYVITDPPDQQWVSDPGEEFSHMSQFDSGYMEPVKSPPLVLKEVKFASSKTLENVSLNSNLVVADTDAAKSFVSEDIYIDKAIGSNAAIKYGNKQIGISSHIR